MSTSKLAIIDINHTVNRPLGGETFIQDPYEQELIPEAIAALKSMQQDDWVFVGASNQGGVPTWKSYENMLLEMRYCQDMLDEHGIYFLTILAAIAEGEKCVQIGGYWCGGLYSHQVFYDKNVNYRKPSTGMLKKAQELAGYPQEVLMIGDRDEDFNAARRVRIPFLHAHDWHEDPTLVRTALLKSDSREKLILPRL